MLLFIPGKNIQVPLTANSLPNRTYIRPFKTTFTFHYLLFSKIEWGKKRKCYLIPKCGSLELNRMFIEKKNRSDMEKVDFFLHIYKHIRMKMPYFFSTHACKLVFILFHAFCYPRCYFFSRLVDLVMYVFSKGCGSVTKRYKTFPPIYRMIAYIQNKLLAITNSNRLQWRSI